MAGKSQRNEDNVPHFFQSMLTAMGYCLNISFNRYRRSSDICEDVELKQRIIEMKDEIESHRATRTRDLVRKRSQNTRRWVPGMGGGYKGRVLVDVCGMSRNAHDRKQCVMANTEPTLSLQNC